MQVCPGSGQNLKPPRVATTIQCPVCKQWIRVRKDGALRAHKGLAA